jgi:tetratricopeptide (TPR) repeat protein
MRADPSTPLSGTIVFTGRLASMKREEAFALVRQKGGTPRRGLTKKTTVLVVGALGWPLLPDGQPAKSLALAKNQGITVASERRFLEWAGRAVPDEQAKTYSASQLAALSTLPVSVIDQLTAFGLLDARNERYGFRDLTAARQLAELVGSGVALSTITQSLHEIRKWLPDAELSNLRLYPASSDAILVEQLKGRTDKTGQFILEIDADAESVDALFEQAQAAEEAEDFETAERLYRKVGQLDPSDPAATFNLGNLLRARGRKVEAEAAYRAAAKADPDFAEAWYNLADLRDEQGFPEEAIAALKRAVAADPDYADAIFNLGLLYQRADDSAAAAPYWRRYLALDQQSPWASRARQALKYCEMKLARSS